MASLIKRGNSMVWWIKYRNEAGDRVFKTTGYRRDDEKGTKLARALEAELTSREFQRQVITNDERWAAWVSEFLARHCKGRTLERYTAGWKELYSFLREIGVTRPRDLTYQHALAFLKWRTAQKRATSKKNIKLNTALNDMKVLRIVMRQAVRQGFAAANPCDRLGVEREETDEKPEFTDADIADIRKKLKEWIEQADEDPRAKDRRWMVPAFEIALNTGCRISDTQIDFSNIDFARKTITFAKPKGGRGRAFSIPFPSTLVPMLQEMTAKGDRQTLTLPRLSGKKWWAFFKQNFPDKKFCFHCTRVTFITRLCRGGVPEWAAMKLVNHASALIHRIYKRLGVEDVRQWTDVVRLPSVTEI